MEQGLIEAAYAREAAKGEIQVLDELRIATLTQHTEMFKWLTASLLAINGGAAISILGTLSIDAIHKVYAGSNFVAGILSALFVGVALQIVSAKGLRPIQALKGYWLAVLVDGERAVDVENELEDDVLKSLRWAWIVPALGWFSGLFFAIGLGVVAHGILTSEGNGDSTSKKIQNSASQSQVDRSK